MESLANVRSPSSREMRAGTDAKVNEQRMIVKTKNTFLEVRPAETEDESRSRSLPPPSLGDSPSSSERSSRSNPFGASPPSSGRSSSRGSNHRDSSHDHDIDMPLGNKKHLDTECKLDHPSPNNDENSSGSGEPASSCRPITSGLLLTSCDSHEVNLTGDEDGAWLPRQLCPKCGCQKQQCRHGEDCNRGSKCNFCHCFCPTVHTKGKKRHANHTPGHYLKNQDLSLEGLAFLVGVSSLAACNGICRQDCLEKGYEVLSNCNENTAAVVFEALQVLCGEKEAVDLGNQFLKALRGTSSTHCDIARRLIPFVKSALKNTLKVKAHGRDDNGRKERMSKMRDNKFNKNKRKVPDLWHKKDDQKEEWSWPSDEKSLTRSPWAGVCDRICWCIAYVQLKNFWVKDLLERPITGIIGLYERELEPNAKQGHAPCRPSPAGRVCTPSSRQWSQWDLPPKLGKAR